MKQQYKATAIILAAFLVAGCTSNAVETTTEKKVYPVEVTTVSKTSIKDEIVYAGRISPSESVNVISKMAGKVSETLFDVGDVVNEGDILFRLDEADVRNQIKQLETQLDVAQLGVRAAQSGYVSATGGQYESQVMQLEGSIDNSKKQLESAEIGLKNAEVTLENAKKQLENAENSFNNAKILFEAGALSKSDFDKAELGYTQAKSGKEQAELAINQATVAYSQAELGLSKAQESYDLTVSKISGENADKAGVGVSQAKASENSVAVQLQIAYETLNDASVKAPISGVISAKTAKAGEFTSTQAPAFQIVTTNTVNVDVKVSEIIINKLNVSDKVEVYIKSIGNTPFIGTIKTVSPAADQTNMFPVKIELSNEQGLIKAGMFAEVRFVNESSDDAIVVPRNVVLSDETSKYVYVNDNGIAKRVNVTTGIDNGEMIEVTSGIDSTSQVVVVGQSYLTDGDSVNVVSEKEE